MEYIEEKGKMEGILLGIRAKIKRYETRLIISISAICSAAILLTALAFSVGKPQADAVSVPAEWLLQENQRVLARPDGGFYLVSTNSEDADKPSTLLVELPQGSDSSKETGILREIPVQYSQLFRRGGVWLAVGRTTDGQSLEPQLCLSVFDPAGDSLADWDYRAAQTAFGQSLPLRADQGKYRITVDSRKNFYGIDSSTGALLSTPLEAIQNGQISSNLRVFSFPESMAEFELEDVEASPSGLTGGARDHARRSGGQHRDGQKTAIPKCP